MPQVQLSAVEERVYQAVSALEVQGHVPYPDLIAQETGMTEEELREPLHSLTERGCCTARTPRCPAWTSDPGGARARWRDRVVCPTGHRVAIGVG